MSVYVNGIKISGRGISGKSPYQIAVEGGYSGTEADFNAQLVAIGEAVKGFNLLSIQVSELQSQIDAAVQKAQETVDELLAEIEEADVDIWSQGTTAPLNTKLLWIDTNSSGGGLKFYNGSAWVPVPIA